MMSPRSFYVDPSRAARVGKKNAMINAAKSLKSSTRAKDAKWSELQRSPSQSSEARRMKKYF
jgi:hypothetical protein